MKRRLFALFLALCMALTLLPGVALAENTGELLELAEPSQDSGAEQAEISTRSTSDTDVAYAVTGGNIYFDKSTGTVADCDETVTEAVIPSVIDGVSATSIGSYAFYGCTSLTSATIPNGVINIGYEAFAGCGNLTDVIIPDSVTSIENGAFMGCASLINMAIPNSVTSIGSNAFYGCSGLTSVAIPESITSIEYCAFSGCKGLTNITIPSNVSTIEQWGFSNCTSLISVSIPISVTNIGTSAFDDCKSLSDVYYLGNEEQWRQISINTEFIATGPNSGIYGNGNAPLTNATIHYNSAGPDTPDPGPDIPTDNYTSVYFLSNWDAVTRTVKFGDTTLISPDTYTIADSVDVSDIDSLLNKYVLVTMEQGNSVLEHTITDIQPVESKIGTVSALGEHSLTIDGITYPAREDLLISTGAGERVLYHTSNGMIMAYSKVEKTHGEIEAWNGTTGILTIDGTEYATNFLTDLSFLADIDSRLNNQYYFTTAKTGDYTVLLEVGAAYYPSGNLEDFNADIYHATWLSKHGNAADMLESDTPSEILMDVVNGHGGDLAIDMWRSFELVFDTLDDVTTLHDFAVEPKDVYSALILNALEASVSYDIVASEYEDSLKTFRECLSAFSNFVKTDKGIDLNNDAVFQDISSRMPGVDVDAYTEEFINDWYKENHPNASDISKSMKYISKGLKVVGTLEDFAEYCAACKTLMNVSDSMKTVLERACLKSAEVYGPLDNMTLAFDDCLKMITRSTDEMFAQIENESVSVIGLAGMKYLVGDVLWGEVTKQIQVSCPEVAALQLVYKAAKTISNQLCHTGDAAEKYLKMDYITDIESMIDVIYHDLEFAFDKNSTLELAQAYLSAMKLSFQLRDVDCDLAYNYVDNIQSSALGSLEELLGGADYESLKKFINNFKNDYATNYILSEIGWIDYLEDDYPGSGLYELYSSLYETIGSSDSGFRLIKQVTAACPVNVYVYDQSENIIASVVDGRVSCLANDIMIARIGDTKVIRFYDGADYRIEYVGYDAGDMDVTVTEYDETEAAGRTVNYYDVALTDGQTYSLDVDDEIMKPYTLADDTNISTVEHDYDSMDTNTAHTVAVISGTMIQSGKICTETTAQKGETIELNAYVPDGYEFVCWETSAAGTLVADATAINTTMIMPDENLIVTAVMRGVQASKTYTVTFDPNGGIVDTSTMTTNTDSKLSNLPIPTRSGYTFDGWYTALIGGTKLSTEYVFSGNTTVYAHWTYIGGSSSGGNGSGGGHNSSDSPNSDYSVSIASASHGKVTASPSRASKGEKVTLTIKPDSGYKLDTLVVKDSKGNKLDVTKVSDTRYTFIMPSGKVSITSTFTKVEQSNPANHFADVPVDAYYANAVAWAVENSITSGTSSTTFSPDATCTRAQMVTFLWRAAGSPTPKGTSHPFTDINSGSYYYEAVLWAVEQGITAGTSATTFAPNGTVTRGQTVTFLHRAAGSISAKNETSFADVDGNAYYANAVQWAAEQNITAGTSTTTFSPDDRCTRAQVVTFLYRANN